MRYWDLKIAPPKSSQSYTPAGGRNGVAGGLVRAGRILHFSSYLKKVHGKWQPGGSPTDRFDPGALEVDFEVESYSQGNTGPTEITIKGIDIQTLNQANKLIGRTVTLKAGMGKGLPLSKPEQAGTILEATVLNAYGNWVGTDMALTVFTNPWNMPSLTQNLAFNVKKGASVVAAINATLQTVGVTPVFAVTDVIAKSDVQIRAKDLLRFYIALITKLSLWMGAAQWAKTPWGMYGTSKGLEFSDGTKPAPNVTQILFEDLIGQPTYNGDNSISFTTAMRADIVGNDVICLPKDVTGQNTYGIQNQGRAMIIGAGQSLFSGNFRVNSIRHAGNSRDPSGLAWTSTFWCFPAGDAAPLKGSGS